MTTWPDGMLKDDNPLLSHGDSRPTYRDVKFEIILRLRGDELRNDEILNIKAKLFRAAKQACIFTDESAEILFLSDLRIDED